MILKSTLGMAAASTEDSMSLATCGELGKRRLGTPERVAVGRHKSELCILFVQ